MNIYALSSGGGPSGIAIIRLSGSSAFQISKLITKQDSWRMNKTDDTYHDIKNLKYTIENDIVQVQHFTTKYDAKDETFYTKPPGSKVPKDPRFNPQSGHLMRMNFGTRK